jgi:hypothetical protein
VPDHYSDGTHAVRLAEKVDPTERMQEEIAWLRQTIYVRPIWERPVLSFDYNMFVNDILDYSDFHVWLTRSDGALVSEVLRDGFIACTFDVQGNPYPPDPAQDLGWRSARFDLSPYKGQTIRIVFENRNLHANLSWGIWTYLDNVRVVDEGPDAEPPGPHFLYLPLAGHQPCDPVASGPQIRSIGRSRR